MANPASAPGTTKKPAPKPAPAGKGQPKKGDAAAPPVGKTRPKGTGEVAPRLRDRFRATIVPALMKERSYENPMQVPRLDKIIVNMGVGEAVQDAKKIDAAVGDLTAITGQHPVVIKAKRSIATFKLRQNMPIGVKVTLRRQRMYEFLDRLITVALPRVRDFRGVSPRSFDGRGNYALGLREQLIFPEIVYDKVDKVRGMDINIVTTAQTDEEAKALLTHLGMPFRE